MKITSTFLMLFALFAFSTQAQTTHEVTVSNFQFDPADLQIEVGDIVQWSNAEGTHNVNGTAVDFPNNPMAFGSEIATGNWVYEFTFTQEGLYEYNCAVHPGIMQGSITVSEPVSVSEFAADEISVFPNPVQDFIQVDGLENLSDVPTITIFDAQGKLVKQIVLNGERRIDLSEFSSGIYTYQVATDRGVAKKGKLIKE
ncbi:MAG TPA: T9SS type A sorting domain-containing protein [Cryomorphaceae bacterium]|nr:T9SS type A sorting domain-containing protein [Cryomorphaceae bacterium]